MADIAALIRSRLLAGGSLYLAPRIPRKKLQRARRVHARHLPEDEVVHALYDDTVFGSGKDGFLITAERLCWKPSFEHPRQVLWEDLRPEDLTRAGHVLSVRGSALTTSMEAAQSTALLALFQEVATLRLAAAPVDVFDGRALVRVAGEILGDPSEVSYHPSIPDKPLAGALGVHGTAFRAHEKVWVLWDDTVLGTGSEGWVATRHRFAWKNTFEHGHDVLWTDLDPKTIQARGSTVTLQGAELNSPNDATSARQTARFLVAVARMARGERVGAYASLWRCPYCSFSVPAHTQRCPSCGAPL